jgi:nicotinamidase-related amidase
MNEPLAVDPKTSALLVVDFQRTIVERYVAAEDTSLTRVAALIPRQANVTEAAALVQRLL